ncbi:glycosyl transferase, partial [Curtobacterium sp. P97]|nr:glycosyl transferase [Curtobacterium sp. P97]
MTTPTLTPAPTTTVDPGPPHPDNSPADPRTADLAPPGRDISPWIVRGSLVLLLVATGALYLWNLSASGYANSFYSAAAQAGSQSWKAFFYGSLDAGNAITVDKPPASLW